ncbi:MAG: hypothetical protein EP330_28730 [Deltaproteobacteria bacterium]|nr:MAG: hypothetical protein EP330_28730 [Deltaproteobacteria bacterium]
MKRILISAAAIAAMAGCDYRGDFLFPGENGVDGVIDLGVIEVGDPADESAVVFAEVGPADVSVRGGATARFTGTGGTVCVWVDPEAVTWNTAVAPGGDQRLSYPDNIFDDGDIDIEVGQSIFYTGTPEVTVGDFAVSYQDAIGNEVELALNECIIYDLFGETGGHSGRAAPEFCDIPNTIPNLEYTVAISTWNTPLDDDVLSFGLLIVDGECSDLMNARRTTDAWDQECVITGEARNGGVMRPSYDYVESLFCLAQDDSAPEGTPTLSEFCQTEAETIDCKVERCYCGDPTDIPEPI